MTTRLGFLWIGFEALAVRLVHLWQTHDALISRTLMGDAVAYDAWARRIAAGDWLGRDVFYQSPLYPYWLAVIYRLTGGGPTAVRVVQSILGAIACVLLAKTTERFVSRRAGWVAGGIMALYPTAIFFDGIIQKSSLDFFLLSLLLFLVARATPRTASAAWLALGLAFGAFVLNRENALLLAAPLALWLVLLHGVRARRWVVAAGLAALGCALVLGTVAVRNYRVGGELHLTTSQFGPNFYIGNRHGASGRYEPLRWGQGSAESERTDAIELAEQATGRRLSSGEVSRYWFGRGLDYIRTEPRDWLRLMAAKLSYLVNAAEITDTEDQYSWGDVSSVLAATNPILHFGVVAPLAALGVVVTWPWRRRLAILYALFGTYAASVLLFFVNARYRWPLLPLLIPFAAAAVVHPWRTTFGRRRWGAIAAGLVLAGTLGVWANRDIVDVPTMRAVTLMNLGAYVAEAGDLPAAARCFARAVELEPDFAEAQYNLGLALLEMNRVDEAVAPFERAARLAPNEPKARRMLRSIDERRRRAAP